jgi:NitT/TauT family transport system ATP-binding protein
LLRLLTGLEIPDRGTIEQPGRPPGDGRAVGMVFQQNSLLPWKRVLANVAFPLRMRGVPRAEAERTARDLLRLVRLSDVERTFPYELSGGMQQRAAIARALAAGGDLLFLDEPFGALDDQTRIALQEALLAVQAERNLTVLFVTHHIEEALVLADRIVVLGRGGILADETVALDRPRDRFAPEFVDALVRLRRLFADAVG